MVSAYQQMRLDQQDAEILKHTQRINILEDEVGIGEGDDPSLSVSIETIESEGWVTPERLSLEVQGGVGRNLLAVYDDFSAYANGTIVGDQPQLGNPWEVTGGATPTVTSGKVSGNGVGTGYLLQTLDDIPTYMAGGVSFSGTDVTIKSMTMSYSNSDLTDLVHFNFGRQNFDVTVRKDGSTFLTALRGDWSKFVPADGSVHPFGFAFSGTTVTIYGPYGEVYSAQDARIAEAMAGDERTVFWEPIGEAGGNRSYLHTASTWSNEGSAIPTSMLDATSIAGVAQLVGPFGGAVGNKNGAAQASIGNNGNNGFPRLTLGASEIHATLIANTSIGATTFSVSQKIPASSVIVFGMGDEAESLTQNSTVATNSTPPHSLTTTGAATKAHLAGSSVTAIPPAAAQSYIELNTQNGQITMFNSVTILPHTGGLYFGTALDTQLYRPYADTLAMPIGDSFRFVGGGWNNGNLQLGTHFIWVDATGDLRIKNGAPASDLDGTVIGTQS